MTEYGRIHTDGSRSGGQPLLKPCPHCGKQCADLIIDQGDKWAQYSASCLGVRTGYNLSDDAPWRAEAIAAYNTRQTTQSDTWIDEFISVYVAPNDVTHVADFLRSKCQPTQSDALQAENERLREHLISALDTLKDAEVCDDNCGPCNEARAALGESK